MLVMHAELARERMRTRHEQAYSDGGGSRLVAARRWQRRAEVAARRARAACDALG